MLKKMEISRDSRIWEIEEFICETFAIWYSKDVAEGVHLDPSLVFPRDFDYQAFEDNTVFGEYTLNPHTLCLDFESLPVEKVEVFPLKEMIGKSFLEVAGHVVVKYNTTHLSPGIEYWEYFARNHGKAPAFLKDGDFYHLLGSVLCNKASAVETPRIHWLKYNNSLCRCCGRINDKWGPDDRVILIKK